jgi:arylsulfatase
MLVRWPGTVRPGVISDQVWAHWDLFATIAGIAGVGDGTRTDGHSMLPATLGQPQQEHEYLYWSFLSHNGYYQAIRAGQWKGIRGPSAERVEVYDLEQDEGEQNDLSARVPEIAQTMAEAMSAYGEPRQLFFPHMRS